MSADREFLFKALQAWMDSKHKIATAAVVANGALLATAFGLFKDKGADSLTAHTVQWASYGIGCGVVAYALAWGYWDGRLAKLVSNAVDQSKPFGAEFKRIDWLNYIFAVFILGSILCFLTCIFFFEGWSAALLDINRAKLKT